MILTLLAVLLLALQVRLWFGDGSLMHAHHLDIQVQEQQIENQRLVERNTLMAAEVDDLKQGMEAVEEIARKDLGMVKENETYFIFRESKNGATDQ
jgi:cell division protein FtsB